MAHGAGTSVSAACLAEGLPAPGRPRPALWGAAAKALLSVSTSDRVVSLIGLLIPHLPSNCVPPSRTAPSIAPARQPLPASPLATAAGAPPPVSTTTTSLSSRRVPEPPSCWL